MYKATNIDTDKVLEAIANFRRMKRHEQQRELHGILKYYEGLERGLKFVESLFECVNYEKEESQTAEPVHTKVQYNNHEYTIPELCQRMAELERKIECEDKL